jgi:hypothetical protein
MAKDGLLAQGECSACGMPGVVGMSCSDPDCFGTVADLATNKSGIPGDDKYEKDLLEDDENPQVVSLQDLEEDEAAEDTDNEDL